MIRPLLLPLLLLAAWPLGAASTQTWEMNTYDDFLKGKFDAVSLTRQGRLQPAPRLETVFTSDEPAIWAVVRAADGSLYLGTGHRGRVYRIDPSGKSEVVWEAPEPEIFTLALDAENRLYVGTSPQGKVYRVEDGKGEEYYDPGTTYIWSLAFGPSGDLFVGTGEGGKVFRVTGAGEGEVYYDTGQNHVTALALDSSGRLLAGTEPNGILYQITQKDRAFVLYDANLPEIRSLVPESDGSVYAAALGGSVAARISAASQAATAGSLAPIAHTSITVTAAQSDVELPDQSGQTDASTSPAPIAPQLAAPITEISGVERSALFLIHTDHTVDKLWNSTEENVYDVLPVGDRVLFSTDMKGRLYELDSDGKVTLLAQTNQGEAIRLLRDGDNVLMATGNMGKIYRVLTEPGPAGTYESPVHDAARPARWGRLSWEANGGGEIAFQTRSGNSARPDRTWSDWSDPLTDSAGSRITSPNARFVQWRARLRTGDNGSPGLDSVRLAYLPQNAAPRVMGLVVSTEATANPASTSTASPGTSSSAAYSITVTESGESGASTVSGTSTQNLPRSASDKIRVSWHTEDLDGDRLIYTLYFRGAGEREWKVVKRDLEEESFTLDSDALADGRYYFRVLASDRRDNPPEWAREGDRVSAPVLVDHTPPSVEAGEPARRDGSVEVVFEARDQASALQRGEYSLDAGRWTPIAPEDGICDAPRERFVVHLDSLTDGEHLLVVRVYDAAQNAGLAKVVLQ